MYNGKPQLGRINPSELTYVGFLGQGAEGFVHEYSMPDGRHIAVKDGQVEMGGGVKIGNPEREAQIISYLHSREVPNTVELLGFIPGSRVSEKQCGPAFAMELLNQNGFLNYRTSDGQKQNIDLLHFPHQVTSNYPLSCPVGTAVVEQVLRHVDGTIKAGISNMNGVEPTSIHRDFGTGRITITDFGLAVPIQTEEEIDRYLGNVVVNLTPLLRGNAFYHPTEYLENVYREIVKDNHLSAFHTVTDRLRKGHYGKHPTEFLTDYFDSFQSFLRQK